MQVTFLIEVSISDAPSFSSTEVIARLPESSCIFSISLYEVSVNPNRYSIKSL